MSKIYIDATIKQLNADIADFQKRIDILNERKEILERISKIVETLSSDEKQAMYEILQEMENEGELGWSK